MKPSLLFKTFLIIGMIATTLSSIALSQGNPHDEKEKAERKAHWKQLPAATQEKIRQLRDQVREKKSELKKYHTDMKELRLRAKDATAEEKTRLREEGQKLRDQMKKTKEEMKALYSQIKNAREDEPQK